MKKTDNSYIKEKKQLRLDVFGLYENPKVLECFAGEGRLWKDIDVDIVSIEKVKDKYPKAHLLGDSLKYLKSLDLTRFNIIDLDAYGIPYSHLEEVFKSDFKGTVIVTVIQSGMGGVPHSLLQALGYTKKMIKKAPTMFGKKGFTNIKNYLYLRGVQQITGYFIERKNYFYFNINRCDKVP